MTLEELAKSLGHKFVEKVDEQLRDLITKNPEFSYNPKGNTGTCSYIGPHRSYNNDIKDWAVDGPECGGCIFGVAFQQLGWTPQEIKMTIGEVCDSLGVKAPDHWINIQSLQDYGQKWGSLMDLTK